MAVFIPVEEVQRNLVAAWEMVEKGVRDFFREEWVEEPGITTLSEDLGVVLGLMDGEEVVEAVEGTLVEAVEIMKMTPVEEGEDPTTAEQISRMSVVTKHLAMAR